MVFHGILHGHGIVYADGITQSLELFMAGMDELHLAYRILVVEFQFMRDREQGSQIVYLVKRLENHPTFLPMNKWLPITMR